jgi:D-lactate dehydrogenase
MKTAVFSSKSYDIEYLEKASVDTDIEFTFLEPSLNPETAPLAKGYEVVCVFVNDRLDAETLGILSSVGIKLVALRSAGFNHVDLEQANRLGLRVVRVPAYSPHAVAEHAVALILTLNRKTHKAYNRVRDGNFSLERLTGFDLFGKTVGVIGTGKIGATFAEILIGFGCRIIAYDHYESEELKRKGIEYTKLEDLLKRSDIISLHCPLTPQTHKMVNRDSIRGMKDGVMLINTSRGKLVSSSAVIEGLRMKKIGYLGIDVYAQEENLFFKDLSEMVIEDETIGHLMTFPNVLITAHQAFFTHEALVEIAKTTVKNIEDFAKGRNLNNEVKTDVIR